VSSQGFRAREITFSTEALALIKEGKIELPLATESDAGLGGGAADSNGTDWEGMLTPSRRSLLNVDKLQKVLEKRSTRPGDKKLKSTKKKGTVGTFGMYREGIKWVGDKIKSGNLPKNGIVASSILADLGVTISAGALRKHAKKTQKLDVVGGAAGGGTAGSEELKTTPSPRCPGRSPILPEYAEQELVDFIRRLRVLKLKAGKSLIIGEVKRLVQGTEFEGPFASMKSKNWDKWCRKFRTRHKIGALNQDKLEVSRAMWSTAENYVEWYRVLQETLVDVCNIAVRNEHYDPNKPYDTMFVVTDKDMIYEWDQTGLTLDQKDDGKAKTEKTWVIDDWDDGTTASNKTSVRWSFTGGSFLNGDALPGLATPPSVGLNPADTQNPPKSNMVNPATGQFYEMLFKPHPSGGVVSADAPGWFRACVSQVLPRRAGKRGCGLCDGLGANICLPVLDAALEVDSEITVRCPHSSQDTQGCDLVNFPMFKKDANMKKSEVLVEKLRANVGSRRDGSERVISQPTLGNSDMMNVRYNLAFSRGHCCAKLAATAC
jgi:hypothetical protein